MSGMWGFARGVEDLVYAFLYSGSWWCSIVEESNSFNQCAKTNCAIWCGCTDIVRGSNLMGDWAKNGSAISDSIASSIGLVGVALIVVVILILQVLVLIMVVLGLKSVIKNEILSEFAFEAFWAGSWQPVERLKIGDGAISTHIVENGVVVEENIPMSHLRIRSRKAMPFDCTSFLRPGVDVCVLSASQNSENTDDERNAEPVWIDAKLRSVERKPHDIACDCNFYVSFYLEQGPDLILANKKLSKETSMIKIDQISVLQRLELKPFLKKTAFDIRSIRNHIVYEVSEYNPDVAQADPCNHTYTLNFKVENEVSTPFIVQFAPDALQEGPEGRESKTYKLEYDEISSDSDEYDEMPLALSVQADNQYQQYGGAEDWIRSYKKSALDKGPQGNELAIVPANTSAENSLDFFDKKFRNVKIPEDYSEDIGDMVSKYFYMNASPSSRKKKTFDFDFMEVESGSRRGPKGTRRKYHRRSSLSASLKRDCVYIRESIYDVRSFRKGSVTAQLCRELIRRCMNNIDATLKNEPIQPPVVDQWKEFQSTTSSNKKELDEKPTANNEEEISEIDMLWNEMELALASWYLFDDNEDSHVQPAAEVPKPCENVENKCEHDFRLNEQVGTTASSHSIPNKEQRTEDEPELKKSEDGELEQFCIPAPSSTPSTIGEGQNNVWALIPDLKDKLRSHQKRAFEFLWRNIAGSLIPSRMEKKKKRRGGCVISHSPELGRLCSSLHFFVRILILDEGHNPRSTKSRLRKALMKVNTRLRVLLSGTLFQNNFGEYFNTLCLARPVFVNEVLKELDPKYEKRNKERQTQFSLENREESF
ncbi:SNF2 domain-containing protein CLASSY 1 [Sesamum angolense]|uniref:SNF2 domain-containing protein CLASSY 1 n=1 Tax=Sesamum angolense TaxID=2727404 RepID=A0AAE1W240_9LAMI|nr:SNF2 domain-containing protein CLASSY 1 [Sesamum angolense]